MSVGSLSSVDSTISQLWSEKYTMAEATDDKDLLAIQSGFENKRVLGKLGEFREFGEEQAKSLNNYFGLMKDKFGVNAGSTYDTGKLIDEVVEKRNKKKIKNIIKKKKKDEKTQIIFLSSSHVFNGDIVAMDKSGKKILTSKYADATVTHHEYATRLVSPDLV